jgi:hypothetical protein
MAPSPPTPEERAAVVHGLVMLRDGLADIPSMEWAILYLQPVYDTLQLVDMESAAPRPPRLTLGEASIV